MSRVAVVLPTYNRARLLARAVRSVLQQSYEDWELWLIDDGSTDDTRAVVEPFLQTHPRIFYCYQDNGGVSRARNRAIFATAAPYVAFLDSDDEWLLDKLERQIRFVQQNPNLRLVHGEEIWLRNGELLRPLKKHQKSGGRIFKRCLSLCCISPSTVMMQTDLARSLGGFREDFPVCEDYDLWLKIAAQEEVGFIPEPLIRKYGGHEDQLSHRKIMDEYRARALWEMRDHPALSNEDRAALLEELEKKRQILIRGYAKHGRLSDAERWRSLHT